MEKSIDGYDYIESVREAMRTDVFVTGAKRAEDQDTCEHIAASALERFIDELEVWEDAGYLQGPDFSELKYDPDQILEYFGDTIERFTLASIRAERKGHGVLPFDELEDESREDVLTILFAQHGELFRERTKGVRLLNDQELVKFPLLYFSPEIFDRLREKYPEFPESVLKKYAEDNVRDIHGSFQRLFDGIESITQAYPEVPESYRLRIAMGQPNNPVGAAKRAVEGAKRIREKYPEMNQSYAFHIVCTTPTDYMSRADKVDCAQREVQSKFPDLPVFARNMLAIRNPKSAVEAASRVLSEDVRLKKAYPDLPDSYRLRILVHNSRDPEKAIVEAMEAQEKLQQLFPEISGLALHLAVEHRGNAEAAARKLIDLAGQLRERFPELPTPMSLIIPLHHRRNPMAFAERVVVAAADLREEFPEMPNWVPYHMAAYYQNPRQELLAAIDRAKRLGGGDLNPENLGRVIWNPAQTKAALAEESLAGYDRLAS